MPAGNRIFRGLDEVIHRVPQSLDGFEPRLASGHRRDRQPAPFPRMSILPSDATRGGYDLDRRFAGSRASRSRSSRDVKPCCWVESHRPARGRADLRPRLPGRLPGWHRPASPPDTPVENARRCCGEFPSTRPRAPLQCTRRTWEIASAQSETFPERDLKRLPWPEARGQFVRSDQQQIIAARLQ